MTYKVTPSDCSSSWYTLLLWTSSFSEKFVFFIHVLYMYVTMSGVLYFKWFVNSMERIFNLCCSHMFNCIGHGLLMTVFTPYGLEVKGQGHDSMLNRSWRCILCIKRWHPIVMMHEKKIHRFKFPASKWL